MTESVSYFRSNSFDKNSVSRQPVRQRSNYAIFFPITSKKGGRRAARAGKLISSYRECSQHEPYAAWLTSFQELKVSASRCGLRYRADYYTARYALE